MLKKRIQFFEWQDLPWFPQVIREGITDYLAFVLSTFGFYRPMLPVLKDELKKTNRTSIIDLCSGSGGILPKLVEGLKNDKIHCELTLTDKFPNRSSFSKYGRNKTIRYHQEPIDALRVSPNLKGLRTLFTSFHHFDDEAAKKILKSAIDCNEPILVSEFTKRNLWTFLSVLPVPLFMPFLIPFVRPFKISTIFFTYILPLIPFFTWWDIVVTVLRTRTKKELEELIEDLDSYRWEIGELKTSFHFTVIYLYGAPK